MSKLRKAKKLIKEEVDQDDPYLNTLLNNLRKLKGEMGYVRTLAKDELEKAKVEIGIKKTIDKKTVKRQQKMGEKNRY
jgi:hypothetical protein